MQTPLEGSKSIIKIGFFSKLVSTKPGWGFLAHPLPNS